MRGATRKRQETPMYTALEDEVFLAPESIISGILAADLALEAADDALDDAPVAGYAVEAGELERIALEA
jgi:hypothetical protein